MRFLLNPSLLGILVLLALLNLAANVVQLLGLADMEGLGRVSQLMAVGFVISLIYTAIWEKPERR
jgi:hypothetical protein